MKVLVLGMTGMLGHMLVRRLGNQFDLYGTTRTSTLPQKWFKIIPKEKVLFNINANNIEGLKSAINKIKPDVLINCIGVIKQLDSAKNPITSITLNSLFPHKLAQIVQEMKIRVIHFSTDCVFSGRKGSYTLEDIPDPVDLYGRSKLLGEISGEGCLTIRSSIIGRELCTQNGLIEWFLSNRNKKVKGYRKALYSGFTTIEMSNIVSNIIINHQNLNGVHQISSETISKFDLLAIVNEKMNLTIEMEPFDEFSCDRSLTSESFKKEIAYVSPSWKAMIADLANDTEFYNKWQQEE